MYIFIDVAFKVLMCEQQVLKLCLTYMYFKEFQVQFDCELIAKYSIINRPLKYLCYLTIPVCDICHRTLVAFLAFTMHIEFTLSKEPFPSSVAGTVE